MTSIVRIGNADLGLVEPFRHALWPDSSIEELKLRRAARPTGPDDYLVLLARSGTGTPMGFAEASLRFDGVNGCDGTPVGFLEGIYVDPAFRNRGVGHALVAEAIRWAGERGVGEFASDALLENEASQRFHEAVGFVETERVVYFRQAVDGRGK